MKTIVCVLAFFLTANPIFCHAQIRVDIPTLSAKPDLTSIVDRSKFVRPVQICPDLPGANSGRNPFVVFEDPLKWYYDLRDANNNLIGLYLLPGKPNSTDNGLSSIWAEVFFSSDKLSKVVCHYAIVYNPLFLGYGGKVGQNSRTVGSVLFEIPIANYQPLTSTNFIGKWKGRDPQLLLTCSAEEAGSFAIGCPAYVPVF